MTTVWIGARKRMEQLKRLAVVFAVPIRLRIVLELYQRDMSASEFYEEFGGGSLSRVSKHFDRLTETGWLRRLHSRGPGGKRRGATETIYRAAELAFCDRETYALLPESIRTAFSWTTYLEVAKGVRGALETSAPPASSDQRLTGARLLLDEEGWTRVAEAVLDEFAAQFEEQEDSRRRAAHTGGDLFRSGSVLLSFELPLTEGFRIGPELPDGDELMVPFLVRLSKVFEDEVCLQLLDEANRGEVSVPTFHAKYGERFFLDEATIRRRFSKLVKYGWLTAAGEKTGGRRRGATEKFYRATGLALYGEAYKGPWVDPPSALLGTDDWGIFVQLTDWVRAALKAGTVSGRDETCLAWSVLYLDQPGWENVAASLEKLRGFIMREQELAEVRLRRTGEEPVGMVVGLGAFETLKPPKEL